MIGVQENFWQLYEVQDFSGIFCIDLSLSLCISFYYKPLDYKTVDFAKEMFSFQNKTKIVLIDRIEHEYLFYCSNFAVNGCF